MILIIESFQFKPTINETFYKDKNGIFIGNTFKIGSFPSFNKDKPKTKGYQDAIDRILTHLNILCNGNKTYANVLKNWIAYQRQYKGIILRWAPVIIGIEGIGKSYFHYLMKKLLGKDNVPPLNPLANNSNFSVWASSHLLVVFDPFSISANYSKKKIKRLQDYLSEDRISIIAKYKGEYIIDNHTNYLFLSHDMMQIYKQISKDDSRFWI